MITYTFLSNKEQKSAEYRAQLAKYARAVRILPYLLNDAEREAQVATHLRSLEKKEQFVLSEASDLYVASDLEAGIHTLSGKSTQDERVYHVSTMDVYTLSEDGTVQCKTYRAQIEGHVNLELRPAGGDSNWWDNIFVPSRSQQSYDQERGLYGKASARQLVIGQFICDHVLLKGLKDMGHNPHRPSQAVDFSPTQSAISVLRNNSFVQIGRLDQSPWGLGNLLTNITNEGAFFRSADSRRSGNYFCPPVSGIPRHSKPDAFWETTFQLHDFFHQAIPDQLFTGATSLEHRNVYVAARLMSEGFTIILADMLFVESVKAAGFSYDYSKRKIHPLLEFTGLEEDKNRLKALLKSNVAFANLGDESFYRAFLKPGHEQALSGYLGTYKHFFVPDLIWSAENYDDMVARKEQFAVWRRLVGRSLFKRAKLPLLDNLVKTLKAGGADLSTYNSAVFPVFEHLFEQVLTPKLSAVEPLSDEQAQSNAFLRYMIGQSFLYAAFRHVRGMKVRSARMIAELRTTSLFNQEKIKQIRDLYAEDLSFLHKAGILPWDDLLLYKQIFPLFSARFLSYDFDKATYNSIPEAIKAAFKE